MPETAAASDRLALLNASCDIAERMLLRGFKHLESFTKSTWADLDKAVDILARVTAIRKSLIHESDRPAPKAAAPQPSIDSPSASSADPSDPSNPPDPPDPSDHPGSANRQSPIVNRQSPSPSSPAPDLSAPQLPAVSPVRAIPVIRDIATMPLSRIEPALNRVLNDLAPGQRRSPERQQSESNAPAIESHSECPSPGQRNPSACQPPQAIPIPYPPAAPTKNPPCDSS